MRVKYVTGNNAAAKIKKTKQTQLVTPLNKNPRSCREGLAGILLSFRDVNTLLLFQIFAVNLQSTNQSSKHQQCASGMIKLNGLMLILFKAHKYERSCLNRQDHNSLSTRVNWSKT